MYCIGDSISFFKSAEVNGIRTYSQFQQVFVLSIC